MQIPEQELRDDLPASFAGVEEGTVGWSGETSVTDYEPGQLALIRVTLRRGRTIGSAAQSDDADGVQVLARLPGIAFTAREAGTRCVVAFPAGDIESPGAGVLLCYLDAPPLDMTDTKSIIDHGTRDLVIRAGSLTFELASGIRIELRDNRLSLFGPLGNEVRLDQIGQILLGGDLAALGAAIGPQPGAVSVTVKAKP